MSNYRDKTVRERKGLYNCRDLSKITGHYYEKITYAQKLGLLPEPVLKANASLLWRRDSDILEVLSKIDFDSIKVFGLRKQKPMPDVEKDNIKLAKMFLALPRPKKEIKSMACLADKYAKKKEVNSKYCYTQKIKSDWMLR